MKINGAIQSYQQIVRQNTPDTERPNRSAGQLPENSVTIHPQEPNQSSKLAVRAPSGNYSEFLTTEEKQAMELLFARYRDTGRFGPSYARDAGPAEDHNPVGGLIDVKV